MNSQRSRISESILVGRVINQGLKNRATMVNPLSECQTYLASILQLASRARISSPLGLTREQEQSLVVTLSSVIEEVVSMMRYTEAIPMTDDEQFIENLDYNCGVIGHLLMRIIPSREYWFRCVSLLE